MQLVWKIFMGPKPMRKARRVGDVLPGCQGWPDKNVASEGTFLHLHSMPACPASSAFLSAILQDSIHLARRGVLAWPCGRVAVPPCRDGRAESEAAEAKAERHSSIGRTGSTGSTYVQNGLLELVGLNLGT